MKLAWGNGDSCLTICCPVWGAVQAQPVQQVHLLERDSPPRPVRTSLRLLSLV